MLCVKHTFCWYLLHDKVGQPMYKYTLTLVNVAFHYEAEPLTMKEAASVAVALELI